MFETVVSNTQALEADLVTTGDMCLKCQYLEAEAGESAWAIEQQDSVSKTEH